MAARRKGRGGLPAANHVCSVQPLVGTRLDPGRLTALVAMKVFLVYDVGSNEALHHKLAITLPSKWLEQSCDKVKELFVERYNKKFPDNQLDDEEMVLAVPDDSPFTNRSVKYLTSSDTPATCFGAGMDVRLVPEPKVQAPGRTASGKLRCKNFGCQAEYDESENCEGACRHHVEPPVFHDTRKWWSCCEGAPHKQATSTALAWVALPSARGFARRACARATSACGPTLAG